MTYVGTISIPVAFHAVSDAQAVLILDHIRESLETFCEDWKIPHREYKDGDAQITDGFGSDLLEVLPYEEPRTVDNNIFRGIPADEVPDCDTCRANALDPVEDRASADSPDLDDSNVVEVRLSLTPDQYRALTDAVGHAWDEVHASAGMSDGWGPFDGADGALSLDDAERALGEVSDLLAQKGTNR